MNGGRSEQEVDQHVQAVAGKLSAEFGDVVSPDLVLRLVTESFDSFAGASIKTFVPVLAYRHVRQRLHETASPSSR